MADPVIPVCNVNCRLYGQDGLAQVGARVTAQLNSYEVYNGYVVPQRVEGVTDADGLCVLALFPNELGSVESNYTVKLTGTNGKTLTVTAVVPHVPEADLENCAVLPPFPGKVDGQLALEAVLEVGNIAQQAAQDALNALADTQSAEQNATLSANNAATSEANASNSASSASVSAGNAAASAASTTSDVAAAAASADAAAASATEVADLVATIDPPSIVRTSGNQTISGVKTFTSAVSADGGVSVPAGASGAQVPQAQEVALLATTQLAGHRNRIINGNFVINQRGYVSGTATSSANQYTLDRWRVVTSGQNLTFSASGNGNQITAPAGGVEQVIEGANIEGGTYVINWTGTATCTINGTARTKGESFTLTANTNATVKFSGGTVSKVQLEPGAAPTVFEHRLDELQLCQRYYEVLGVILNVGSSGTISAFPKVSKRAAPTLVLSGFSGTGGVYSLISPTAGGDSGYWQSTPHSTISGAVLTASSEL